MSKNSQYDAELQMLSEIGASLMNFKRTHTGAIGEFE
jgi:hypothetical protein